MKTKLNGKELLEVANQRADNYLSYWKTPEIVDGYNTKLIYASGFVNGVDYFKEEIEDMKRRLLQIHKISDNLNFHPDFQKIFDLSKI